MGLSKSDKSKDDLVAETEKQIENALSAADDQFNNAAEANDTDSEQITASSNSSVKRTSHSSWRASFKEKMKNENAQKLVLAFVLLKTTGPLRMILTLTGTPPLARFLRAKGLISMPKK